MKNVKDIEFLVLEGPEFILVFPEPRRIDIHFLTISQLVLCTLVFSWG